MRRLKAKNGQRCQDCTFYISLACQRKGKGKELPRPCCNSQNVQLDGEINNYCHTLTVRVSLGQLNAESSWDLGWGRRVWLVKQSGKCIWTFLVNLAIFSKSVPWHFVPCHRYVSSTLYKQMAGCCWVQNLSLIEMYSTHIGHLNSWPLHLWKQTLTSVRLKCYWSLCFQALTPANLSLINVWRLMKLWQRRIWSSFFKIRKSIGGCNSPTSYLPGEMHMSFS